MTDNRVATRIRTSSRCTRRRSARSARPAMRPTTSQLLVARTGERATLDESYRLCAQCHFAQADAWAGGGHGKRLDGWQGRRVVMACTDCHDPHAPAPRRAFRSARRNSSEPGGTPP